MKVIMTGGGTGGHIYPAVAIADEIRQRCEDAEILFVGAEIGQEKVGIFKISQNEYINYNSRNQYYFFILLIFFYT